MKLTEFIEDTGTPIAKLAKKAGVSTQTLHNLLGGRDVKASTLVKVQRATKGKVTCEEIYEELIE